MSEEIRTVLTEVDEIARDFTSPDGSVIAALGFRATLSQLALERYGIDLEPAPAAGDPGDLFHDLTSVISLCLELQKLLVTGQADDAAALQYIKGIMRPLFGQWARLELRGEGT